LNNYLKYKFVPYSSCVENMLGNEIIRQ